MVAAHHAGADKANAQRLVHGRPLPIISGKQHAWALLSIMPGYLCLIGAYLLSNIKY